MAVAKCVFPVRHVIEELALDVVHFDGVRAGAVARGKSPVMPTIAGELERVVDRVLLLRISRAAAVLEIVDAFATHEGVLNAAKVDPDMRELMCEQRPGVKIFLSITVLPKRNMKNVC